MLGIYSGTQFLIALGRYFLMVVYLFQLKMHPEKHTRPTIRLTQSKESILGFGTWYPDRILINHIKDLNQECCDRKVLRGNLQEVLELNSSSQELDNFFSIKCKPSQSNFKARNFNNNFIFISISQVSDVGINRYEWQFWWNKSGELGEQAEVSIENLFKQTRENVDALKRATVKATLTKGDMLIISAEKSWRNARNWHRTTCQVSVDQHWEEAHLPKDNGLKETLKQVISRRELEIIPWLSKAKFYRV